MIKVFKNKDNRPDSKIGILIDRLWNANYSHKHWRQYERFIKFKTLDMSLWPLACANHNGFLADRL